MRWTTASPARSFTTRRTSTCPATARPTPCPVTVDSPVFASQESRLGNQTKLPWQQNDWVAFLGASYFRAIGELYQYGLSARASALDVAEARQGRRIPAFTRIWFEPPKDLHATSHDPLCAARRPSICGAYRFVIDRTQGVIMDVDCSSSCAERPPAGHCTADFDVLVQ